MRYLGRRPASPLDRFTDDVYCLSGEPGHRQRLVVPPMPSAHLMLNLGDPVLLHDREGGRQPEALAGAWFMGLWTRRFVIEYGRRVDVVGVHFKPWGLAAFIDAPLNELRDRAVPADALWGASLASLRDRLGDADSLEARLDGLEGELRARLRTSSPKPLELVRDTGRTLERSWGARSVTALSDDAGVSGNHLASRFTSMVGITPKRLARIYRFARVILSIDATRPPVWAELAQTTGYFDQPHLINEFRDFTGRTPTDYLALRRRYPPDRGFPPDMGPMPVE